MEIMIGVNIFFWKIYPSNPIVKKYKNSTKPKTVKKEETVYYENADEVTIDKSRILTL